MVSVTPSPKVTPATKARGEAEQEAANARRSEEKAKQNEDKAKQNEAAAVAARKELEQSNDRLVTGVARSLLRPLAVQVRPGQPLPPLSDPECEALWELACSSEGELRVRFVEEALRGPVQARQLKERAAYALQAALVLDSGRRARVEVMLGERLRARGVTAEQRRDVALVLAQIQIQDSALAGEAVLAFSAVAARLEPKAAAAVCGQAAATLRQAMTQMMSPYALLPLAQGLSAVAARLEPKAAAAVCGQVAATLRQAMTQTTDLRVLQELAQGLSAVLLREDSWRGSPRYRLIATVGVLSCPASLLSAPALLQPTLEPPPPLPAQTLVDLLKQPFCVGEARRLVLGQLARHYQRSFADQWDFVRFAQEQKLDLDLTSPPKRPELPPAPPR
jgi:hypothetical protein